MAAVTTARVAEESGISNGSIYHRFGSRRELLMAAFDQFIAQLQGQVRMLRAAAPDRPMELTERVFLLVRVYQAIFSDNGPLIRAFFIDALDEPEVAARGEAGKAMFAQQVADFLTPEVEERTSSTRTSRTRHRCGRWKQRFTACCAIRVPRATGPDSCCTSSPTSCCTSSPTAAASVPGRS